MGMRKFLVCGATFLSASVFAQGGYVGVSVGQSDLGVSGAEDDTSYGIAAGYQLNDNLALEAGYTMYGDFEYSDSPEYSVILGQCICTAGKSLLICIDLQFF